MDKILEEQLGKIDKKYEDQIHKIEYYIEKESHYFRDKNFKKYMVKKFLESDFFDEEIIKIKIEQSRLNDNEGKAERNFKEFLEIYKKIEKTEIDFYFKCVKELPDTYYNLTPIVEKVKCEIIKGLVLYGTRSSNVDEIVDDLQISRATFYRKVKEFGINMHLIEEIRAKFR